MMHLLSLCRKLGRDLVLGIDAPMKLLETFRKLSSNIFNACIESMTVLMQNHTCMCFAWSIN